MFLSDDSPIPAIPILRQVTPPAVLVSEANLHFTCASTVYLLPVNREVLVDPMKANRTLRMKTDDRAQVGIGTMIVFIATILVAAAAAALLLDTSGKLQERSSQTGSEATKEVSSNLIAKSLYGVRPATTGNLEDLNITIALAPGAASVDLSQMIIKYSDGSKIVQLNHATAHANDTFVPKEVRDPKGTFEASSPVMTAGALVDIQIDLNKAGGGMTLGERSDVTIQLIPESGTPVELTFTTPPSFGTDKVVTLR